MFTSSTVVSYSFRFAIVTSSPSLLEFLFVLNTDSMRYTKRWALPPQWWSKLHWHDMPVDILDDPWSPISYDKQRLIFWILKLDREAVTVADWLIAWSLDWLIDWLLIDYSFGKAYAKVLLSHLFAIWRQQRGRKRKSKLAYSRAASSAGGNGARCSMRFRSYALLSVLNLLVVPYASKMEDGTPVV